MPEIKDAEGQVLYPGDRVYAFDIDGSRVYGTLQENDYKNVSEWSVAYDDGEECAVLDFNQIFKA